MKTTLKKRAEYICIIAVIVLGAFFPPVWLLLLLLTANDKDKANRKTFSSSTNSITKPVVEQIALNVHRLGKYLYLQSHEWQDKRKVVLSRAQYKCECCNISNVPLEVHHITYINFGCDPLDDLTAVCRECHQRIHNKHGYDYNNHFPLVS